MRSKQVRTGLVEAVPPSVRGWLRHVQRTLRLQATPAGTLDWGGLRRVSPVSAVFGLDRGLPIDRYYIEQFLAEHAADVQGHVLEFGDDRYIRQFGGGKVTHVDVIDVAANHPGQTIKADLSRAEHIPSGTFDCIICTQTLQMIFDIRPAIGHLVRMLKPGGVLLATEPRHQPDRAPRGRRSLGRVLAPDQPVGPPAVRRGPSTRHRLACRRMEMCSPALRRCTDWPQRSSGPTSWTTRIPTTS